MYKTKGQLRWYQGPISINEIFSFITLIGDNKDTYYSIKRSKNLELVDSRINFSDWAVGVMEGFKLLHKLPDKSLMLSNQGLILYVKICENAVLNTKIHEIIKTKKIGRSFNDIEAELLNLIKHDNDIFSFFQKTLLDSEQFYNALFFIKHKSKISKKSFINEFYELIYDIYYSGQPQKNSKTAKTGDNRLPFIYHLGLSFNILKLENSQLSITNTVSRKLDYSAVIEEYIDDLDQEKIQNETIIYDKFEIEKINNREPQIDEKNSKRFKTSRKIAKLSLKNSDFQCVYGKITNHTHITFPSTNGENYVEAHHLIPMSAQKEFKKNLDRVENIFSLCPICHTAIHYSIYDFKFEIFQSLYHSRKIEIDKILKDSGFSALDIFKTFYV